jgi:hemolysin activation/secretion protein
VSGVRLTGEGFYMSKALDVEEGFGGVEGSLSGYVGNRTLSLAARVAGRTLIGDYPWFESAYIGGSDTVRAYRWNRFRGDSSLYGNLELRVWSRASTPVLPIRLGLFGYVDTGRVWYEGEESDTWHSAVGAGLMGQLVGMPMMFAVSAAAGDEGTRVNFVMGYSF